MIWKTTILLSLALFVLGDGQHAISEQRIKIHKTEHHDGHNGDLKYVGSNPPEHHEEYAWSYPSYEFSYKVHDPHTHDMKGHEESRHGDDVKGEYWLIQPDGHKRTVTYHVDKDSGFKATVKYSDHHNEDDHGDDKKDGGEGSDENEAMSGGDESHGEDKGHNDEGGRDGEESRDHEGYRRAWAIAKKEHVREESRMKENRDYDDRHGGDGYEDMTILENMGNYGRRESGRGRGMDEGRRHDEIRVREENHKESRQRANHGHDTYNYPRFYREIQPRPLH